MPKSSFIHLLLSFHFLSYGGEERGDTHSPLSSHPVIILSPLTISSLWLLDLFTVAMSPFHIALYRFRLQMKKTKSAWCKVCATGLVFGFQLNKTHGCHLWVQLIRVLNSNTVFPCMPHPAQDTVKRLHSVHFFNLGRTKRFTICTSFTHSHTIGGGLNQPSDSGKK